MYLIDMEGNIVHCWHCKRGVAYGHLLPAGNILPRTPRSADSAGAQASDGIQELNWEGEVVWEYRNPHLKRYGRLPNGNTLIMLWEKSLRKQRSR